MSALLPLAWAGLVLAGARGLAGAPPRRPVSAAAGPPRSRAPFRPDRTLGALVRTLAGTGDRRSDARRGRFVLVVLLLAVAWPPGAAAAVLAATVRLVSVRRRRARAELDAVWAELPEVVELLALAVGAGLTPAHALGAVSNLLDGPVSRSFGEAIARTGAGERLADALAGAAPGVGHPSRPVFDALVAAERYGTPLLPALQRCRYELRAARRRRAEEAARIVPVRLLLPLVGCILPAFVLLTFVPLVAGGISSIDTGW